MPRYIDADKIAEHKFLNVTHNRYVSDGRPKSEEEIYAYKVGYNDAIESIAQFAPTADVVDKERYDRLLKNSIIISEALNRYQTADAVQMVRCKDCLNRFYNSGEGGVWWCRVTGNPCEGNAFCSYGERREDGEVN